MNKTRQRSSAGKRVSYDLLKNAYEDYKKDTGKTNIQTEKMISNYNNYTRYDFEKMENELYSNIDNKTK